MEHKLIKENEVLERGRKIAAEIGLEGCKWQSTNWDAYPAETIHRLLGEGAEVLGHKKTEFGGWGFDQSGIIPGVTTHTALLIAIRPIVQESAEDILRKWVEHLSTDIAYKRDFKGARMNDYEMFEQARALLAKDKA